MRRGEVLASRPFEPLPLLSFVDIHASIVVLKTFDKG